MIRISSRSDIYCPVDISSVTMTSACMLIRTEKGKYQEVVDRLKQVSSVKSAFPVLGRYDIAADIEVENATELGKAIMKVNKLAGIVFTETMPEIEE